MENEWKLISLSFENDDEWILKIEKDRAKTKRKKFYQKNNFHNPIKFQFSNYFPLIVITKFSTLLHFLKSILIND
jgi:hypothetical protein